MNLTLRTIGKNACETPDLKVLHLLNDLIEHENFQIRTYVNGTLYSLFSRKSLKDMAKALGMDTFLKELLKQDNTDQQYQRQIQYILKQLNSQEEEEEAKEDSDTEVNDEEDNDED